MLRACALAQIHDAKSFPVRYIDPDLLVTYGPLMRIKQLTRQAQRVVGPIGKCIYCGSEGSPGGLTREHAVPFALDGYTILLKASCDSCRTITQKIEEKNLKGPSSNFGLFRSQDNYRTRRPKNRIKVTHQSLVLVMPKFSEPGIFSGGYIGAPFKREFWFPFGNANDPTVVAHAKIFNIYEFMRMLAKIALCEAYASDEFDLLKTDILLPDFILGKKPELGGYLIGQSMYVTRPPLSAYVKGLRTATILSIGGPTRHLSASIHLFAKYETPIYSVVIGRYHGNFPKA